MSDRTAYYAAYNRTPARMAAARAKSKRRGQQLKLQRNAKKMMTFEHEELMKIFEHAFAIAGTDWEENKDTAEAFAALLRPLHSSESED